MNPNDVDLQAAAQAQAEQSQREYEARMESNRKKIAASVALKAKAAEGFKLYPIDGAHPVAPQRKKSETWTCSIQLFKQIDGKPLSYDVMTETNGTDLCAAVDLVLRQLRLGEIHFTRRAG